jgi:hypothetical protein
MINTINDLIQKSNESARLHYFEKKKSYDFASFLGLLFLLNKDFLLFQNDQEQEQLLLSLIKNSIEKGEIKVRLTKVKKITSPFLDEDGMSLHFDAENTIEYKDKIEAEICIENIKELFDVNKIFTNEDILDLKERESFSEIDKIDVRYSIQQFCIDIAPIDGDY